MPSPDRIDRTVAWWARTIGYAEDDDDVRLYTHFIRGRGPIGRALRPLTAATWMVTAGAMSVAVPIAIGVLMVAHKDSPLWDFLDPDRNERNSKDKNEEERHG